MLEIYTYIFFVKLRSIFSGVEGWMYEGAAAAAAATILYINRWEQDTPGIFASRACAPQEGRWSCAFAVKHRRCVTRSLLNMTGPLPWCQLQTCSRCIVGKSIAPQIRGGCDTFGPMMIVDGWWQSPLRAQWWLWMLSFVMRMLWNLGSSLQ